jgi:hypothetical protein
LQAVADRLHCSFSADGASLSLYPTLGFHLFSQGRSKKISNVLRKSIEDAEVSVFDYKYTTGGGKNSHTYRQSVVLFDSPALVLPSFTLAPENILHKIGQVFGYQDIDFDTNPNFSGDYLLKGEDEAAIRRFFTHRILRYYEEHPGMPITEGSGQQLIVYKRSYRAKPEDIGEFLQQGLDILALFTQASKGLE